MRLSKGLQEMEGAWIVLLLPRLQPYSSSASDGMDTVEILERAIDRQAFVLHQNDDFLQTQGVALRQDSIRSRPAVRLHETIAKSMVPRRNKETAVKISRTLFDGGRKRRHDGMRPQARSTHKRGCEAQDD